MFRCVLGDHLTERGAKEERVTTKVRRVATTHGVPDRRRQGEFAKTWVGEGLEIVEEVRCCLTHKPSDSFNPEVVGAKEVIHVVRGVGTRPRPRSRR